MAKIKINGDSSGYVELAAPNAAHNNTLELGPGTKILTDKNTHTGNIGIGTDNPQKQLQILGDSDTCIRVTSTAGGYSSIQFGDTVDTVRGGITYYSGDDSLELRGYNNSTRLRITSGGNIAYGNQSTSTANNSSALVHISAGKEYWSGTAGDYRALKHRIYDNTVDDVYGMGVSSSLLEIQAQVDIGFFAGGAGSGTGRRNERLRIKSNGEVRQQSTGGSTIYELKRSDSNTTGAVGTINFTASDDHSVASIGAMGDGDNEGAHIVFRTTSAAANNSPYNAATAERLRITSAGNIGIGTITPNTGNPSGAKYLHIHNSDGSTNSNSPSEIYFTNANSGAGGGAGGMITFYNRGFYFWNYQNDDIHFGTGGSERFKFDHSANTLDFISTSKIRLKGSNASGTTHAHLNIGSDGAGSSDTRAIDIWGNWSDQEAKTITWNHGSGTSDMVCQQRVRYNASPSSTVYEIGRFFSGQNTTAFPFQLQSSSTTTADLTIDGNVFHKTAAFVARSSQNNNITSTTRAKIDYTVDYSYQGVFSNSNDRFTAQKTGLYFFYARHWFGSNSTGTVYMDWLKNGALIKEFRVTHPYANSEYESIQGSGMIYMAVNDYLEVYGRSDGSGVFHESNGAAYSEFSGFYVGG